MLAEGEKKFVELIMDVGGQALEQDVFEVMMDEGLAVDLFRSSVFEFSISEVTSSLEKKDLAYTETSKEIIRDSGDIATEPINFNDTEFKTVEREYIYFTEEMAKVYGEESSSTER